MENFRDFKNIHEMLRATVERRQEHDAYRWFIAEGETESVTWNQLYSQVRQVTRSLIALGIEKGDKVDILSYSCYRWILTDYGVTSIGAATVGIYQSLLAEDCKYIINHSDARLVFVEDETQLKKVESIRGDIPAVEKVILLSGAAPKDDWVMTFEEFLDMGKGVEDTAVDRMIDAVTPEDVAGIVYTSGTTGVPKGAMLTHDNITFTAQSVEKSVYWQNDDHVFLFLPLAHVFARTCLYTALLAGSIMTFARSMETVAADLKAAQPHWFPSVPRIFEKVHAKVIGGVEAKGGVALKIFNWAMGVGRLVSDMKLAKGQMPLVLELKYKLATKLVFHKIQDALGGRVRWCISGAAPLNPDVSKFFHAAGILILEGIGMTENTSFTNLNRYRDYRFGWVGQPGPGIEQKTGADGEVLYRGRNVMKGYYKMPEETADTMTEDGWLKTGDIGEIDGAGFLRITGRKKELIVTSGGKNVAPAPIEGMMAVSKYINQVFVIGDQRKFLSALVTLDPDNIAEYARQEGIAFDHLDELAGNEKIIQLVENEVMRKNEVLPSFETIKKVKIVPEFTIENGLLTPTMKLKKNIALEQYQDIIDQMYEG